MPKSNFEAIPGAINAIGVTTQATTDVVAQMAFTAGALVVCATLVALGLSYAIKRFEGRRHYKPSINYRLTPAE